MKRTLAARLARLERELLAREMRAEGEMILVGDSNAADAELLSHANACGLVDRYGRVVIGGDEQSYLAGLRVVRGGCPSCSSERWDRDHEPGCRWAALPA